MITNDHKYSYIMYAFGGRLGPRGALEPPFLEVVACGIVVIGTSEAVFTVAKVD